MRNSARTAVLTGLVAALGIAFCTADAQACHRRNRCGCHGVSYASYGGCYGGGWGGGWGGGGWGGGWGHAGMPSYQGGMASYQNVGYGQGGWGYDGGYAQTGYANYGYAPAGYTPTAYYGPGGSSGGGNFEQGFVQGATAGALGMPAWSAYGGYGPYGYTPYGGGVGQNLGSYAGYRAARGIFGR
jgi:hypothetical protein